MDWYRIIGDMLQRGETLESIGLATGTSGVNIGNLMRDPTRNPRWHLGDAILAMHGRIMRSYPKVDTVA